MTRNLIYEMAQLMDVQIEELKCDLLMLQNDIEEKELQIQTSLMTTAMYKALFFKKYDLAIKIENQIRDNDNHLCRCKLEYFKTLDDMYVDGTINNKEYQFCMTINLGYARDIIKSEF